MVCPLDTPEASCEALQTASDPWKNGEWTMEMAVTCVKKVAVLPGPLRTRDAPKRFSWDAARSLGAFLEL